MRVVVGLDWMIILIWWRRNHIGMAGIMGRMIYGCGMAGSAFAEFVQRCDDLVETEWEGLSGGEESEGVV